MARPRARRTTRNPAAKTRRRQRNPYNISLAGAHPIVQRTWSKTKTLRQNYAAMGLVASVNGVSGGSQADAQLRTAERARLEQLKHNVEWRVIDRSAVDAKPEIAEAADSEEGDQDQTPVQSFPDVAPIEPAVNVDPRTKAIGFKVDRRHTAHLTTTPSTTTQNPTPTPTTAVIQEMEEIARNTVQLERKASDQEHTVLRDLIAKHGSDYLAMSKDIRLNKYQFSAGQLKRKIRLFIK